MLEAVGVGQGEWLLTAVSTVQLPILQALGQETDAVLKTESNSCLIGRQHYTFVFSSERCNQFFALVSLSSEVCHQCLKGSDQQGSNVIL